MIRFFFFFNPTDRPNIRKCIRRQTKKRGIALGLMGLWQFYVSRCIPGGKQKVKFANMSHRGLVCLSSQNGKTI